jgi:Pyruvate/2-oxoacid:ferredoxin oxidoreductase delta subunit/NAD(P)H-dependent FMN reductase
MSQLTAVIRYFTGTGNTKRVADGIGKQLTLLDHAVNAAMITDNVPFEASAGRYVFCSPVYALGLPRVFKRYLAGLPGLTQAKPAMLVVTAGNPEHTGWALRHGRELLDARGYDVTVSESIQMPDNWTPFLPAPEESVMQARLAAGDRLATALAREFASGNEHHRPFSLAALGIIGSWLVHHGFHGPGINRMWKLFKANDHCTSCALCARICPLRAIAMVDGKPEWSKACEQCCRCFNYCPERAIEQLDIIGKGSGRGRYYEPGFKP